MRSVLRFITPDLRRMAEAHASLPLSQQAIAAEHSGFLLTVGKGLRDLRGLNVQEEASFYIEHFSRTSGEL